MKRLELPKLEALEMLDGKRKKQSEVVQMDLFSSQNSIFQTELML